MIKKSYHYHDTQKNRKESYRNNKFKISAPTQNDKIELSDGSYSVSDIQNYFEYTIKKHEKIPIILQEEYKDKTLSQTFNSLRN